MPEYRLTTENGDVVDSTTQEHDQAAVSWRSAHMFEAGTTDQGRQLNLERNQDGSWVQLRTLGLSDAD